MKPLDAACVPFLYALLLCGCYSRSTLTEEEVAATQNREVLSPQDGSHLKAVPPEATVYFHLNDGSCVVSAANNRRETEDGCEVWGYLHKEGKPGEFRHAVLRDADILEITAAHEIDAAYAVFNLKDGSYVKSQEYDHWRVERGYRVSGDRYTRIVRGVEYWQREDFSGVIEDSDILTITVDRFNLGRTVIFSVLAGGVAAVAIVSVVNYLSHNLGFHFGPR